MQEFPNTLYSTIGQLFFCFCSIIVLFKVFFEETVYCRYQFVPHCLMNRLIQVIMKWFCCAFIYANFEKASNPFPDFFVLERDNTQAFPFIVQFPILRVKKLLNILYCTVN